MRLPNTAHTRRPWRIHELTPDFRVEDVWALPTPGGPDDLSRLVQQIATGLDVSGISRLLFAVRWKLGALLGWDTESSGIGTRVQTLRDRLPTDLRDAPRGPDFGPFRSLYQLDDEWAAEIANSTVHGVIHIGWVPDEAGGYRGQMAVLVKPNGPLGAAYMAAIAPFRYSIVYPALMRTIGRQWRPQAHAVPVPDSIAALKLLDRVDYQDAFALTTSARLTPEEWMRLFLESSQSTLGAVVGAVFKVLRFGSDSPGSDDPWRGWQVLHSGPEVFVLGTDLGIGLTARLIAHTRPREVVIATQDRLDSATARAVWRVIAPIHRRAAVAFLSHAATLAEKHHAAPN
jgi:Protein of unknown function (DUF2867)